MKSFTLIALIFLISAPQAHAEKAAATITGTEKDSDINGSAVFEDTQNGLKIQVQVAGLAPGIRGFHIHEKGNCGDTGKAAGDHFNPAQKPHGLLLTGNVETVHAGDLGNIQINENGEGALALVIPGLTVSGKEFNVSGRSVIVHEKRDDFSQPTGNAGGRVACGVIETVPDNYEPPALKAEAETESDLTDVVSIQPGAEEIIPEELQPSEKEIELAEQEMMEEYEKTQAPEPVLAEEAPEAVETEPASQTTPPSASKKKQWWQW